MDVTQETKKLMEINFPIELQNSIEHFIDHFVVLSKRDEARLFLCALCADAQKALLKKQMEELTPTPDVK